MGNSEKENLDLLRVLDDVNLQLKTQIDKLRKKEKQHELLDCSHSEKKVNQDLLEKSKLGCKKTTVAPKISESKANANESEKCNIKEQQIAVQCITSTVKRGDNHSNRDNTNNNEKNSVEGGGSLPYYCPLDKKVNQDLLESSKSYDEETTVAPKISESKENIEENEKYDVEQYQVINKCIRSTAKCEDDN